MAKKTKDESIDFLSSTNKSYDVKIKKNKNIPNKPVSKKDMINLDDEVIIGLTPKKNQKGKKDNSQVNAKKKSKKKRINKNKKIASQNNNKIKNQKNEKINNQTTEKEPKKSVKMAIIKCTSIALVFAFAIILFGLSPVFNIKQINVVNNSVLSDGSTKVTTEEILALAQIPETQNIFSLDSNKVIERIKSNNSFIDNVIINKDLPNAITITVEERIPRYMIKIANGTALIDAKGNIIEITDKKLEKPVIVNYEKFEENKGGETTTKELKVSLVDLEGYETSIESIIDYKNTKTLTQSDIEKLEVINQVYESAKNNQILIYITGVDISDIENVRLLLEGEKKVAYLGNCSNANLRILYLKTMLDKENNKEGEAFINGDLHTLKPKPYFREKV